MKIGGSFFGENFYFYLEALFQLNKYFAGGCSSHCTDGAEVFHRHITPLPSASPHPAPSSNSAFHRCSLCVSHIPTHRPCSHLQPYGPLGFPQSPMHKPVLCLSPTALPPLSSENSHAPAAPLLRVALILHTHKHMSKLTQASLWGYSAE